VLPEYGLTPWVPEHPDFAASCADSTVYLPHYQALARELNIHIIPGTIIELGERVRPFVAAAVDGEADVEASDPPATELCNMAYLIAVSSGDIPFTYQKKNLWHSGRSVLAAELHTPHKAFDVPLPEGNGTVRVGMLICCHLAFPEAFQEIMVDGAQLIVVPSYWHITNNRRLLTLNPVLEVAFLDSVTCCQGMREHVRRCTLQRFGA
jgi:predicted amidohydrolase